MIEPVLPMEAEQLPLMEAAANLRTEVAGLLPGIGASSREALALLLRAMNSYYSNKIVTPTRSRGSTPIRPIWSWRYSSSFLRIRMCAAAKSWR